MDNFAAVEVMVGIFGGMATVIQVLGLFILSDIRRRVARLENKAMGVNDD